MLTESSLRYVSLCLIQDIVAKNMMMQAFGLADALKAYNPDQPRVPAGSSEGGQWTGEGGGGSSGAVMDDAGNIYPSSTYEDFTVPESWANPDIEKFGDHYLDHSIDFDAKSPEDYARQANQFYQRGITEKLPAIEYSNGGRIAIYDPVTNDFGIYTPEGKTVTFYKPTSSTYFQRQIIKALGNDGRVIEPLPIEEPIVPEILIP